MSLLLRCDVCAKTIPKSGKMPEGWSTGCEYTLQEGRQVFVRMNHACPACPRDIERPGIEMLPICTVDEALTEVVEAARFAVGDSKDLKGASRRLLVRALAILDAARARIAG